MYNLTSAWPYSTGSGSYGLLQLHALYNPVCGMWEEITNESETGTESDNTVSTGCYATPPGTLNPFSSSQHHTNHSSLLVYSVLNL